MRKARDSAAKRNAVAADLIKDSGLRWPATDLRIAISGGTYPSWRGAASRQHNSIKVTGSFHSLQRPSSYEHWYAETPPGFVFSVKGARFITHMKKPRDVYACFDNDAKVHAPFEAKKLAAILRMQAIVSPVEQT